MKEVITVMPGSAYPLGVHVKGEHIEASAQYTGRKNCGICFYRNGSDEERVVLFDESCRSGALFSAYIEGIAGLYDSYLLYEDGRRFPDPYARKIIGLNRFDTLLPDRALRCALVPQLYDWSGDIRPEIPYKDSFIYLLHVRGFTMRAESGVSRKNRGTFRGLIEKIPYLKSLGVTAVELMPIYECRVAGDEAVKEASDEELCHVSENGTVTKGAPEHRVNYWGYKDGYYFAPRSSYCADKAFPVTECKDMIHAFHEQGMEVILQFYFAEGVSQNLMIDCVRYWVSEYHIDGIHLKSLNIPAEVIASDPMLKDIKILCTDPGDDLKSRPNLAGSDDNYAFCARHFLKSDDNSAKPFLNMQLMPDKGNGRINYICEASGFTLRDLVSYDHKRNEANKEGGTDGRDDNCSWNCGYEGETRRKGVKELRRRQMLNALSMVMLSRGTPLIYAGDEMGNTQEGNNNPWCQDNRTGWTTWDARGSYAYITDYVRFLSDLRKEFPFLHPEGPFRIVDHLAAGYPDLSFHGTTAWQPELNGNSHAFGMLYCGWYHGSDTFLYVIYNMYWKDLTFDLPKLPKGSAFYLISDTSMSPAVLPNPLKIKENSVTVSSRSVSIFKASAPFENGKKAIKERPDNE